MKITVTSSFGMEPGTYQASRCLRPRFSAHGGRTWDVLGKTDQNEDVHADTTWGVRGYVQRNGKWYCFKLAGEL